MARCHTNTVRCKCVSCSAGRDPCDPPTKGVVGFDSVSHSPSTSATRLRGLCAGEGIRGGTGREDQSDRREGVLRCVFPGVVTRPGKMVCHEASGKYSSIIGGGGVSDVGSGKFACLL